MNDAVYVDSASVSATNSGDRTLPPWKLKPFNTGISQDNGKPAMTAATSGSPMMSAMDT